MKIRHHSKKINRDARKYKKRFQDTKDSRSFAEWLNCMVYAPAYRMVTRSMDTKYFETKINQRRRRKPSDFCDPLQNFYNKTIKRLGWDK